MVGSTLTPMGALVNVAGDNTIGYRAFTATNIRSSEVRFNGIVGIGVVDQTFGLSGPAPTSKLTFKSSLSEVAGTGGGFNKYGIRAMVIQADGSYTGAVDIVQGYVELHSKRRSSAFSFTIFAWYSTFALVGTASISSPMYSLPPDALSSPRRSSSLPRVTGSTTSPRWEMEIIARKIRRCRSSRTSCRRRAHWRGGSRRCP